MKQLVVLCCIFLMAACVPANSSEYILYYLNKGFDGRPVNAFFYEYGLPTSEFADGDNTVYRWTSIKPKPTSSKINPVISHCTETDCAQEEIDFDTSPGAIKRQYCEIHILTHNGIIQSFAIVVDSIGKRSSSRCSEIFNQTYP